MISFLKDLWNSLPNKGESHQWGRTAGGVKFLFKNGRIYYSTYLYDEEVDLDFSPDELVEFLNRYHLTHPGDVSPREIELEFYRLEEEDEED